MKLTIKFLLDPLIYFFLIYSFNTISSAEEIKDEVATNKVEMETAYEIWVTKNFETGEISFGYRKNFNRFLSGKNFLGGAFGRDYQIILEDKEGNVLFQNGFSFAFEPHPKDETRGDAIFSRYYAFSEKDSVFLNITDFNKLFKIKILKNSNVIFSVDFNPDSPKSLNGFFEKPDLDVIEIIGEKKFCKTELQINNKKSFYQKNYTSRHLQYKIVAVDELNKEFQVFDPFYFAEESEKIQAINKESPISTKSAFLIHIKKDAKIKKLRFYNREIMEAEFDVDLSNNQTVTAGNIWKCLWDGFKDAITPSKKADPMEQYLD